MNEKRHDLMDDPRLTAWVIGELDPNEAAEIAAAVEASPELQKEVEQIRAVCDQLTEKFSAAAMTNESDEAKLTSEQKQEIASTIAESTSESAAANAEETANETTSENAGEKVELKKEDATEGSTSWKPAGTGKNKKAKRPQNGTWWRVSPFAAAACMLVLAGTIVLILLNPGLWNPQMVAKNEALKSDMDEAALVQPSAEKSEPEDWYDGQPSGGAGSAIGGDFSPRPSAIVGRSPDPTNVNPALVMDSLSLLDRESDQWLATEQQARALSISELNASLPSSHTEFGEKQNAGNFFLENVDKLVGNSIDPNLQGQELAKEVDFYEGKLDKTHAFFSMLESDSLPATQRAELRRDDVVAEFKNAKKVVELQFGYLELLKSKSTAEREGRGFPEEKQKELETLHKQINDLTAKIKKGRRGKSWKRVRAIPNTSRLMIGDKDELNLSGMQVNVQIDGFRARVVIDYFYYNDRERQLEGSFKLRLPNEASPYYFAFGESRFDFAPPAAPKGPIVDPEKSETLPDLDREFIRMGERDRFVSLDPASIRDLRKDAWNKVKEAKMVPREKAAFAYQQTTKRRIDPALVEWAGAGVFNAKVFPLSPRKLHRIVVGYDVNLTQTDEHWMYQLALPEHPGDCLVDVRVSSTDQVEVKPAVEMDRFDGSINFRLDNPKEKSFAIRVPAQEGIVLRSHREDEVPYFATRARLPLDSKASNASSHAVFLVDTSLSSNPEKFNLWLQMLTRLLKDNRDAIERFNVIFFNVEAYWWQQEYAENTEQSVDRLMKYCNQLTLEGATDLYSAIRLTTTTSWIGDQRNAKPDIFLLSDGAATWGETNLQLIGRQLSSNRIGKMFAYQAGMTGTSIRSLQFLTSKTGGAVFSVAGEDEAKTAARAHRKQPWRLTEVRAEGTRDLLTGGRVQWVYPDQSILIVGRGSPIDKVELLLEQGEKKQTVSIDVEQEIETELAFRAYGQVAVGQLENLGDRVNKISTAYARHFRVTGQTCSLLMLDSEEDYQRFDIKPEDDEFVVSAKTCRKIVTEEIARNHEALADPKTMLKLWLQKLESAPQINFKIPTALELALDKVRVPIVAGKLECKARSENDLEASYYQSLSDGKLKYDQIVEEAKRRRRKYSDDDAIKALSSLIENNPGDLQLIRDVAFIAMEFNQPEHAYPLLKKVAMARPYNAVVYTALAQCLIDMGNVDLAMVFYEIAVTGTFQKADFRKIATTEYVSLLTQVERGEHQSALKAYAKSRLKSLIGSAPFESADLVVTMMWNTDRSDVDLHVVDSAGEECFYEHPKTRMGGRISADITDGYGPEMFWLPKARSGRYQVKVNYYGSDNLRSGMRSKIYINIYRNFGKPNQTVVRKTISLGKTKEMRTVSEFTIK